MTPHPANNPASELRDMGINNFAYDSTGLTLTEQAEGLSLQAYQDQGGIWTIGYGHTGPDVAPGMSITREQAEELLQKDIASACSCVNNCVAVQLSQDEFDALVDFVFNLGPEAFKSSTLLRDLNAGNFAAAASQFDVWDHLHGAVVAGLLRRREQETALFQSGASSTVSS